MEGLVLSSTHGFTQCWCALPSTDSSACRHCPSPACTSQSSHACCQQLTWTPRQDLSQKELCGCSSGKEKGWQHRLPFAMSIQAKVLSRWLLTSTTSPHQLGALLATAGPISSFLPLICAQGSPFPSLLPNLLQPEAPPSWEMTSGEHCCPIPLCRELGLVCISTGGEIILLPLA